MQKNFLETKKTARYFTLGKLTPDTERIIMVCHGYGQLAEYFIKKFEILSDNKTFIIAPEALNRFYLEGFTGRVGATWMTSTERETEIQDYIHYLTSLYHHHTFKLNLHNVKFQVLGFSQGVPTVCRWLVDAGIKPEMLVLWGGWFPKDLKKGFRFSIEMLKDTTIKLVYGRADPYILKEHWKEVQESVERYPNLELISYDGKHEIVPEVLREIWQK